MQPVHVVYIHIGVGLKRRSLPLLSLVATYLEVDRCARTLHYCVDAVRLVRRRLKDAINRIETESKDVAVVLGGLAHLSDAENWRR